MTNDQKFDLLYDIYEKATDNDNAEKFKYANMLDKEMMGKIMNEVQSYDYLDNNKYKRIEYLLSIMNETFGFDFTVDIEKDGSDEKNDESKETAGNVEGDIELTKNQTQKRD